VIEPRDHSKGQIVLRPSNPVCPVRLPARCRCVREGVVQDDAPEQRALRAGEMVHMLVQTGAGIVAPPPDEDRVLLAVGHHAPSTHPALTDLLGGHIVLLVSNVPVVLPVIKEGRVVPLAMTTAERSPLLPDVPTLAEAGVAGIDVTSWYGLLAPRATPKPVLDAIFKLTSDILASPALREKLEAQGLAVKIEAPDVFADRIRRETAMWRDLIRQRDISAN